MALAQVIIKSHVSGASTIVCRLKTPRVSRDTVSRWTKNTLRLCGIDTKVFTAHSTRSASVSKAHEKDVPVHEIMAKAGWRSAGTFRKYYYKPVIQGDSLASAILDQ